ncbi:isoamylase early set domain-containing protein [Desulfovibrio litoralis]|uniref:Glycogen recognition site of AMP-activated protein kinase n=1 Tax=Desulfovibrio litoralis DSM 11393 TaxID=1121455 RepID=A0A1M7SCJ1_9BACT|nr:isoamylase early set domain-containing protein [Desulfovibrio litoralis]SHN56217.1 hypothetical protein SAMN02745728_00763 [Desulfovibrio litoralis DSM 11393]
MPIIKTYNKVGDKCRVRFKLFKDDIKNAKEVALAASFTDWELNPMKILKDGSASIEFSLPCGEKHCYRYVLNSSEWINDPEADEYTASGFEGVQNSVVAL